MARHRRGFYRRLSHDGKLSQRRSGVVSTATEFLEELGSGCAQPQPKSSLYQPALTDAIQVPQLRPNAGGLGMPSYWLAYSPASQIPPSPSNELAE